MLALGIAALAFQPATVIRDAYGVPMIHAESTVDAFRLMGRVVAEDRLWQLEMSRRTSLGQMAEVLGPAYEASDRTTLAKQYTTEEYDSMVDSVPPPIQEAWRAYVAGINDTIDKRIAEGTLPEGYQANGFQPRPWTMTDTAAIMVNLSRQFGQGGAGELRNYAMVQYLRTRPAIKDRVLDALDDLAWANNPESPTTVAKRDDLIAFPPRIFDFSREESDAHLKALPPTNLLELAGAIRLASMEDQKIVAEANSVPFKSGSYAVVVSPRRSLTGQAMIMSAPQMGHATPSIVHEVAIDTPDLKVAGMDVPGIPGVIIGYTPNAAWGLTSGVADLEDIFVSPLANPDTYVHNGQETPFEKVSFTLKVKGQPDKEVTQLRTVFGPVLLKSTGSKAVYSLNSAFWKREIQATSAVFDLYTAKEPADFTAFAATIPVSFNLFFATAKGDIGYRYCGRVPIRAKGVDPRLPTIDTPANQWQGFVESYQMPRCDNPESGLITNWNNKPVAWWPNGDTPVWGKYFRVTNIRQNLGQRKLSAQDVANIVKSNATQDEMTADAFAERFKSVITGPDMNDAPGLRQLAAYKGKNLEGEIPPTVFYEAVNQLRRELFLDIFGNFTSDALFNQILQLDVMVAALDGKTKIDYLAGRPKSAVILSALGKALDSLTESRGKDPSAWGYRAPLLRYGDAESVPYSNRGTYIQLTEFGRLWPSARSVAAPGVAESGPNAFNQVPLVRGFTFKPMWGWK